MRRALLIVASLSVLAGCGGDDAVSADEYREEVKRVCVDAGRATQRIEAPTRATNQAIADYFGRLLAVLERSLGRLEEVKPPSDLADAHDDALEANRAGVEEVRKLVAQLEKGGDATAILQDAPERLSGYVRRSREAARRLGVPECGR